MAKRMEADAIRSELDRILSSPDFGSCPRLAAFLRYVVEQTLEGKAESIKEFSVATDVFGRPATFDPQTDTLVRVNAVRLRRKLADYYAKAGASDGVILEIPRGSYVPRFREAESAHRDRGRSRRSRTVLTSRLRALFRSPLSLLLLFASWFVVERVTTDAFASAAANAPFPAASSVRCATPAFSPDGLRYAYISSEEPPRLWIGSATTPPAPVTGTEGASGEPSWSPDGTSVAYVLEGEIQWFKARPTPSEDRGRRSP